MEKFITNKTKYKIPKLPIEKIKNEILGKRYELSIVFVGEKRAKDLNKKYRKKDYTPSTLSFPISKSLGEIIICPNIAKRKAKKERLSEKKYIGFLLIHSMLHLQGKQHGSIMESKEQKYLLKFFNCKYE